MAKKSPTKKRANLDIARLKNLTDSAKELLFKEYSAWARHHHTLVWTTAAFGVTIQLVILGSFNDLRPWSYTVVAAGGLVLLYVTHKIADGNRRQWQDYKSVANMIELHWGLRDPDALNTQLNEVERKRNVRVQPWRIALYWVWVLILVVTIMAKWLDCVP